MDEEIDTSIAAFMIREGKRPKLERDVLAFSSKSKGEPKPTEGAGEERHTNDEYTDLVKIKDWRRTLSNFHLQDFVWRGHTYGSIEHAFQGAKIALADPDKALRFTKESGHEIGTGDAGKARGARRLVVLPKAKLNKWDEIKRAVMADIAAAKYSAAATLPWPNARDVLKATLNAKLVHIVARAPRHKWEHFDHLELLRESL